MLPQFDQLFIRVPKTFHLVISRTVLMIPEARRVARLVAFRRLACDGVSTLSHLLTDMTKALSPSSHLCITVSSFVTVQSLGVSIRLFFKTIP